MKLLRPDTRTTSARSGRAEGLTYLDYLILMVAAAHWPLGLMAKNHWQVVHPERVLVMVLAVAIVASLVALAWVRLGGDRRTAVFTVFIGTVFFMRGGPLLWRYGTMTGWLVIIGAVLVAGYLGHRLKEDPALGIVTAVLVVLLGSGTLVSGMSSLQMGDNRIMRSGGPEVDLSTRPDVYLVVLDGYPGHIALQSEFGVLKEDLVRSLRDRGFVVPESAWTPYWSTERAVAAILDMSYPAPSEDLSLASRKALADVVAGDNNTMDVLIGNGYETTMLESGWVGSSCEGRFDHCVPSAWLDELGFAAALETAATQHLVSQYGNAFSVGSLSTMEALKAIVEAPDGDRPRFVFAHVVAPHWPFLLDENCQIASSVERITASAFSSAHRDEAVRNFLSHAGCVDRFILEFAELVDDDDAVVFVGDHGTDRATHLLAGATSDPAAVVERMNVFVAALVGARCDVGDPLLTSNLMRRVLSCYSSSPVPDIDERMFLPDNYELSPLQVRDLLNDSTFVAADVEAATGG